MHRHDGPCHGSLVGAAWNSQAFFAVDVRKHFAKAKYVMRLLRGRDFVLLSEAHVTEGDKAAWRPSPGFTAMWSTGTSARAGVGIILRDSFLRQFDPDPVWDEPVPGRAAVLRLRGPLGALDIWTVYFATGTRGLVHATTDEEANMQVKMQRQLMRERINAKMSPKCQVLSVIGGDFNWVVEGADRTSKDDRLLDPIRQANVRDKADEDHWREDLCRRHGLHELHQTQATHDDAGCRSRIDRIYWNAHVSTQLDTTLHCVPLTWVPHLSHHRALAFGRRRARPIPDQPRPVPAAVLRDPAWPVRVAALYWTLLRKAENMLSAGLGGDAGHQDSASSSAAPSPCISGFARLRILKEAMRTIADTMGREKQQQVPEATEADDHLGWTLRCVRALERGAVGTVRRCCQAYPRLGTLLGGPLEAIQAHAVELARDSALRQLREIQNTEGDADVDEPDFEALQRRRNRVMQLLARLAPGRSAALGGVVDRHGDILTDPEEMAQALRSHWQGVFRRRQHDDHALRRWCAEDLGPAQLSCLRRLRREEWLPSRADLDKAIKEAPKSSPGPDGLPLAVWRSLGPLGGDVLEAALRDMMSGDGPEIVARDCPAFNDSLMVFLPKAGTALEGGERLGCKPDATRPLSIANGDSRILANAVRLQLEKCVAPWISREQQGFLPGRSMISNIVAVEERMMG